VIDVWHLQRVPAREYRLRRSPGFAQACAKAAEVLGEQGKPCIAIFHLRLCIRA
jgi:hypothetical protein